MGSTDSGSMVTARRRRLEGAEGAERPAQMLEMKAARAMAVVFLLVLMAGVVGLEDFSMLVRHTWVSLSAL